jgi:hypothetical protein
VIVQWCVACLPYSAVFVELFIYVCPLTHCGVVP